MNPLIVTLIFPSKSCTKAVNKLQMSKQVSMAPPIKTMCNYANEVSFYGLPGLLFMSHIANENGWEGIHRYLQLERDIQSALCSLKIYLNRKCATLSVLIVCACSCVCVCARAHMFMCNKAANIIPVDLALQSCKRSCLNPL
jgi:hypothetical protein